MLLSLTTNQERKSNPSTSRHSYRHSLLEDQPIGNTFVLKLFQEHFMESFFHSYKGYVSGFQLQKPWRNWFQDSFSPPPLQLQFYAPSSWIFGFDFFCMYKNNVGYHQRDTKDKRLNPHRDRSTTFVFNFCRLWFNFSHRKGR